MRKQINKHPFLYIWKGKDWFKRICLLKIACFLTCLTTTTAVVPLQEQSRPSWSLISLSITLKAQIHASFHLSKLSLGNGAKPPSAFSLLWSLTVFIFSRAFFWFSKSDGNLFLTVLLTMWPFFPCPSKTPQKAPCSIP